MRSPSTRSLLGFATAALLVAGSDAAACSVCFSGIEQAREAYYLTTVLLIALPFGVFAVLVLWLRRAARARGFPRVRSSASCGSDAPG